MSATVVSVPQEPNSILHLTYRTLRAVHRDRSKLNKKGEPRPEKSLENIESTLNRWMKSQGLDMDCPVGEELGLNFQLRLRKYLEKLVTEYSAQYVKDVKCRLDKFRETYLELMKADDLPKSLPDAVQALCARHKMRVRDLAEKLGLGQSIINLIESYILPNIKEVPSIHLIEDYFGLPRNALVSKLPPCLLGSKTKSRRVGATAWRANLSELKRLSRENKVQVLLPDFKGGLKEEWGDLYKFYTDGEWLKTHNLKRNSRWTIREDGYCGSADRCESTIAAYMGFLRLPENLSDPRLRGRGYREEELSLAFFSSVKDVKSYIQFLKKRTPGNVMSTKVKMLLNTCNTFLLSETGFLWQQPQYGERLPVKVPRKQWRSWCNRTRKELKNLLKGYITDGEIQSTRKALELVKPIVRAMRYPLDLVEGMLELMREALKYIHNDVDKAVAYRDYLLVKLESCIPLRAYNVSLLTCKDDNSGSFRKLDDGTWWLYIPKEHFKNRRREDLKDFDVQIEDEELIEALETYLRKHRKYLLGGKCDECADSAKERRDSECQKAQESGKRCEWSHYLFAPRANSNNRKNFLKPWGTGKISFRILCLTQEYMPQYPGFSIHWFRHLLASDYIKNHPNGFGVAAMLLHDTEPTVRKYYSWVEPADGVRIYNQYRRERKKEREQMMFAGQR